jgi:FtsH-binding integral membrane protein
MSEKPAGKVRKRSFISTMVAIAWSFVGLRSKKDFDEDAGMNPVYVIIAGLIGVAIFIAVLMFFVKQAVG